MTVGSQPIIVTSLGRFCVAAGNVGSHEVRVIRVSDNTVVASANVSMSGCPVEQFKYAALGTAVTLSASTAYLVVSYEVGRFGQVPRLGVPTFNSQLKISKYKVF